MVLREEILFSQLNKHTKFAIYGIGGIGKKFLVELKKANIFPDCILVTTKNDDQYEGIPIKSISEISHTEDLYVLICVSSKYQKEIEDAIKVQGIKYYGFVEEYAYVKEFEIEKSSNLNNEEWKEYLCASDGDFNNNRYMCISDNFITFVVSNFSVRLIKMVGALAKRNYQIRLIVAPDITIPSYIKKQDFDKKIETIFTGCITELHLLLLRNPCKIIHLMTSGYYADLDKTIIEHKSLYGNVVYDSYDILNYFYLNISEELLRKEKFCIENADGICNRGHEQEFLREKGWNITGIWVHFPDYCSSTFCRSDNKSGELEICYVGGVDAIDKETNYMQDEGINLLKFAYVCKKSRCHLHIYPTTKNETILAAYYKEASHNKYLHMHSSMDYKSMINEISQYDAGVLPVTECFLKTPMLKDYYSEKLVYGANNKFWDYLDAGLPVCSFGLIKTMDYLEMLGIGWKWPIEKFDFEYLSNNIFEMKDKVEKVHFDLEIDNNIKKVICLYEQL